jgi:hypothetical protein
LPVGPACGDSHPKYQNKKMLYRQPIKHLFAVSSRLQLRRQGLLDAVERVVDLLAQDAHDRDHDNSNQGEDNRIFNKTLSLFFQSE